MTKYCSSCGAPAEEGTRFCGVCDASLEAAAAPSAPPAPSAPYVPPYPASTPPPPSQPPRMAQSAVGAPPLSVGQYIGMFILAGLPVIGFILLLVWAFSGSENPNRRNYARAILILMLIGFVLMILLWATLIPLLTDLFQSVDWYAM